MARFSELGLESDVIIGKGIDLEDIFDKRILIEKVLIQPTKFPGKNQSGLRIQMQVVLATFNEKRKANGEKPLNLFPMDTTIVKVGKCFQFT